MMARPEIHGEWEDSATRGNQQHDFTRALSEDTRSFLEASTGYGSTFVPWNAHVYLRGGGPHGTPINLNVARPTLESAKAWCEDVAHAIYDMKGAYMGVTFTQDEMKQLEQEASRLAECRRTMRGVTTSAGAIAIVPSETAPGIHLHGKGPVDFVSAGGQYAQSWATREQFEAFILAGMQPDSIQEKLKELTLNNAKLVIARDEAVQRANKLGDECGKLDALLQTEKRAHGEALRALRQRGGR